MAHRIIATPSNPTGIEVELTAEEVTQRETDRANAVTQQEARDAEIAQKATNKANAKAKLIAGEALTEAEANTIVI